MIIRADVYPHSPHRSDKSTKTEGDLQVAVAMAMAVAGRRSTLNPDAPIFIPVAFQQVEDFSPEWWELVKTSTWFRDYWLTQHQEGESYDDNTDDDDIANLLPESFDIGFDEYNLDAQFEELIRSSESENQSTLCASMKEKPINGSNMNIEALMKNLSSPKISNEKGPKHLGEPAKFRGKPLQCVSPKSGPRRIHQPR